MTNQKIPEMFFRAAEVARILGIGKSTVWKWIHTKKDEGFPQPIKMAGMTVFRQSDIERYQRSLIASCQ